MTRVNTGIDLEANALGGDVPAGFAGTSSTGTPPTATTLTDSGSPAWTTNQWAGHVVSIAAVQAVVISNTASALTVLGWYSPNTPGNAAAAATPAATTAYQISAGQAPARFIGLTATTTTIAATDAFLAGELFNAGGGLNRALAAHTHTVGVASYTLTKTYTSNGSDGSPVTVHRIGVHNCMVYAAPTSAATSGIMMFETNLTNDAVLVPASADQLTITEVVSI